MNFILIAALGAALSLPAAPVPSPASEWTQTGYGPGLTFYNPHETELTPSSVGTIKRRWDMATHGSLECEVGREPLAGYGNIYTSDPGGVGAYDPATGKRRWHADLKRRGVKRMALADDTLVTLTYACDRQQSYVTAFRATTGTRLWDMPLSVPSQDMIVDRGVIVVDSRPDFEVSTVAHRLSSGARMWKLFGTRADGLLSAQGRLLLRAGTQGSRAVDIKTGATIWSSPENWTAVGSNPSGSRFYVSRKDGGLAAIDAANGNRAWDSEWQVSAVTADDNRLYFPRGTSTICVDARNGKKLWSIHLPNDAGQPVRAGKLVYSPSGMGDPLSIADAVTGKEYKGGMPSGEFYPPTVADGRLFLTDGSRLRAYF
ncbi:outer membrane protein assembly factor BamB family protein [Actinoplanes flavus]|uniref:PQQ-binding-like beta-propeller repeat protein n=1 Tax=Actinoplanes flavus TaxID=2820290 RepID=A0ABS3UP33_9ACTN|nr:PQQ-binding-like beta-propeller repeat protein [Actinoplanes flavus]MBO3740534.1 PQQ-binding-like beta-propeller repeat protein [Actinoplanes flavus]